MKNQIVLNQQTVNLADSLRAKSGGIISIREFAALRGFDLADKDQRKTANREYSLSKRSFYQTAKQIAALAVADDNLLTTKARPVFDKAGEFRGVDVSHRIPSQAFVKATKSATIAEKDAEIAALRAQLAALQR